MENENGSGALNQEVDINTLVDKKISQDADFQAELVLLPDEDREQMLAQKRSELINQEVRSLANQARKNEELATNYKIRAEKAEKDRKERSEGSNSEQFKEVLSTPDTLAIVRNNVHEDDVEEVIEYAKFKNVSVAEVLKSGVMKTLLAEKEEMRRTANATNTGKTRTGVSKPSADKLLEKARTSGELPESDEDLTQLVNARLQGKR
jgi:hypothetical protein